MSPRSKILLVAIVPVGLLGFTLLSWRPSIAPVAPPAKGSFSAGSVRRGEVLAAEAHCISCHTGRDGQPFAGGYGVNTPFGVIFGTNITPDPKTGIGDWSREAFRRALREGVSRDGSHLFAAFPYPAYTKLSDADVDDLYAYMMTRPPVVAQTPTNTIPFPLNIRPLQAGWKLLFFRGGRFRPDAGKTTEWNRGAYLAEAVADCEGCHTPRNPLGGGSNEHAFEGALVEDYLDRSGSDGLQSIADPVDRRGASRLSAHRPRTVARSDFRHHDTYHSRWAGASCGSRPGGSRDRRLYERNERSRTQFPVRP